MLNLLNAILTIATGDDSNPWLIVICLIVSLVIMGFLFLLGGKNDDKNNKTKFTFFITLTFASIMIKPQAPQDKSRQWQLTILIAVFFTRSKKKKKKK